MCCNSIQRPKREMEDGAPARSPCDIQGELAHDVFLSFIEPYEHDLYVALFTSAARRQWLAKYCNNVRFNVYYGCREHLLPMFIKNTHFARASEGAQEGILQLYLLSFSKQKLNSSGKASSRRCPSAKWSHTHRREIISWGCTPRWLPQ